MYFSFVGAYVEKMWIKAIMQRLKIYRPRVSLVSRRIPSFFNYFSILPPVYITGLDRIRTFWDSLGQCTLPMTLKWP